MNLLYFSIIIIIFIKIVSPCIPIFNYFWKSAPEFETPSLDKKFHKDEEEILPIPIRWKHVKFARKYHVKVTFIPFINSIRGAAKDFMKAKGGAALAQKLGGHNSGKLGHHAVNEGSKIGDKMFSGSLLGGKAPKTRGFVMNAATKLATGSIVEMTDKLTNLVEEKIRAHETRILVKIQGKYTVKVTPLGLFGAKGMPGVLTFEAHNSDPSKAIEGKKGNKTEHGETHETPVTGKPPKGDSNDTKPEAPGSKSQLHQSLGHIKGSKTQIQQALGYIKNPHGRGKGPQGQVQQLVGLIPNPHGQSQGQAQGGPQTGVNTDKKGGTSGSPDPTGGSSTPKKDDEQKKADESVDEILKNIHSKEGDDQPETKIQHHEDIQEFVHHPEATEHEILQNDHDHQLIDFQQDDQESKSRENLNFNLDDIIKKYSIQLDHENKKNEIMEEQNEEVNEIQNDNKSK